MNNLEIPHWIVMWLIIFVFGTNLAWMIAFFNV